MMHGTRGIIVAVLLAGCTDFPDRTTGTCGNGGIDRDEDCDAKTGCEQCSMTCTDELGCERPGYLCGADGLCHAPSGIFQQIPKTSFEFVVGQGVSADIDADGIGDVIGFSDININVHYGDRDASFTTQTSTLLPASNGNFAIRNVGRGIGVTADNKIFPVDVNDMLFPMPDGIASFTSQSKKLVSYPFANDAGPRGACATQNNSAKPVSFFSLDKRRIGVVSIAYSNRAVWVSVMDAIDATLCVKIAACNITAPPGSMDPDDDPQNFVDHYETLPSGRLSSVIAVGVPGEVPMNPDDWLQDVCVVRFDDETTGFKLELVTPSALSKPAGPIALARATEAATCPTLFTATAPAGGVSYYPGASPAGKCTLTLTPQPLRDPNSMVAITTKTYPAGRIPLQPAITGRAPDSLVLTTQAMFGGTSIAVSLAGVPDNLNAYEMYSSPRGLFPIYFGDIDGDGQTEGIASVFGAGIGGQPNFDVLYRTAGSGDGFVPYRLVTQSVPQYVAIGDYDGNATADIAYIERIGTRQRLMVSYGTRDRPLEPIEISTFLDVVAFARVDMPDSLEPSGTALDDLIIVDEPTGAPLLTIMHGTPQRSMLAYFDPRPPSTNVTSDFLVAIPGNFDSTSEEPTTDVLALERVFSIPAQNVIETVRLWVARGVPGTLGLESAGPPIATPFGGTECIGKPLCISDADYVTWPIADGSGTRDVVLAVGVAAGKRTVVTIDPRRRDSLGMLELIEAVDPQLPSAPSLTVFDVFPADLDGNGVKELTVVLGDFRNPLANAVFLCDVDDETGRVTSCSDLTTRVADLANWTCMSAASGAVSAAGRFDITDTTPPDRLLVLCKRLMPSNMGPPEVLEARIFRVQPDADGNLVTETVLIGGTNWQFFSMGDLNGDRVADIVGIDIDFQIGIPTLYLHLQCEARAKTCREDNEQILSGNIAVPEPMP